MMLLEFIGIIGAAVVAVAIIGMVIAGASVVFLSAFGFVKELMIRTAKNHAGGGEAAVMHPTV